MMGFKECALSRVRAACCIDLFVVIFVNLLAGIFKQKQIPFLLLGADSENGDISTQINTEDNAYVQNAERGLWNLYMEMRRLDAKYHKLQKKLEILEQSSESSLQPQQVDTIQ